MDEMNNNYDPVERIKIYSHSLLRSIEEIVLDDFSHTETEEERNKLEYIYNSLNKPENVIYMEMISLSSLIKNTYPSKVKVITLSDLSKYDVNYRSKLYTRVAPIIEAFYITGICSKAMNIQDNEPDKELVEYLRTKAFPEIVTSDELENFKNLIIKILKKKEFQEKILTDAISIYILDYTCNSAFDIEFSKSFAKELGYLSNNNIIELYQELQNQIKILPKSEQSKTAEDYVHDFLDMNEVFERFEKGKITGVERQILRPEDYVYRFLQNYYSKKENATNILDKVKVITLINMYKSKMISFDDLYVLLTAPESRFSKCNSKEKERLKSELRKIYINKKESSESKEGIKEDEDLEKRRSVAFSSLELLKLAQIGLIKQEDMLGVYASQRHMRKVFLEECKSSKLYEGDPSDILRQYQIIPAEDMLEYFDEKDLIDMYIQRKKSNNSRKKNDKDDFMFPLACAVLYIPIQDIEVQIITDERIKPEDILFFHEKGVVLDETIKTLTLNNSEFKRELFNHISQIKAKPNSDSKREASDEIFEYFNRGIINEDDLIEILDDEYEAILREAFRKRYIRLDKLKELTFLDNSIVMEEYNKSLKMHIENPETADQEQDFESILDLYLLTDGLVNFEDLYNIVKDRKDPVLQDENFDLSNYIYNIIITEVAPAIEKSPNLDKNILISKIKELYINSFLTDELNKLVENGVIGNETAKQIDDEFCASENYQQIWNVRLGDSDSNIPDPNNTTRIHTKKSVRTAPKLPTDRQVLQADAMVNYMTSIGFEPKTVTNAYGIEEMETFDSGDFKDYRIFLSRENPHVVILVHLKQITNTDTYYHVGDNATYIMSSSTFLSYLKSSGKIDNALASFYATKSKAKNSIYTRTANVGKAWGRTIPKKICQIMNVLDNPELQEMKNANFEIDSLLPNSLITKDKAARLEEIQKCLQELNTVREITD